MTVLDDFFGDGAADNTPECSFCGGIDGELIVSISDAYGPTHWHHQTCKADADIKKGTPIPPTWEETMDETRLCLKEDSKGNWQPLFSEDFM
jgi:hypothetical protein